MPSKPKASLKKRVAAHEARVNRATIGTQVDEIIVDAKLEKTGEATRPATSRATTRPVSLHNGRVCAKCHGDKVQRYYRIVQPKRVDPVTGAVTPLVRDSVCTACRAEEKAADLKAQVLERQAQNLKKAVYKEDMRQRKASKKHRIGAGRPAIRARAEELAKQERQSRKDGAVRHKITDLENEQAQAARRELARRELARRRLLYFTRRFEGQQVDEETGHLVEVKRTKGKGYVAGWVHHDVCARLERFWADVQAGLQPRLMLFEPPRHGKSTLASRMFPGWALGNDPSVEIIAASYGASLPEQFSRNVRGLLRNDEYQAIFPKAQLNPEQENIQGWATTLGGQYMPVGVGSGVTGKGADILIIDDPFKGAEDAENPNQREKVLDWYYSEALTRLSPNAGVLIICTRWHDEDLAGALMSAQATQEKEAQNILEEDLMSIAEEYPDQPGIKESIAQGINGGDRADAERLARAEHKERMADIERWEVVSYSAIAESDEYRTPSGKIVTSRNVSGARLLRKKGEALHEARYPLTRLRRIKKGYYSRGRERFWHALYQQKPVPDEGVHFSRDMIVFEDPPAIHRTGGWMGLSAWDLAAGQKQQHDFTVGSHGKMDFNGLLHVTELIRGRFDGAAGVAKEILDEFERNHPRMIGVERGPLEQFVMPSVKTLLEERNKELHHKGRLTPVFAQGKKYALTPITDLVMCARPLQSLLQQGKIVFSSNLAYTEEMIQEMLRFPNGAHDDVVASLSWLVRLSLKFPTPKPTKNYQKPKDSWRKKLAARGRQSKAAMAA